MHNLFQLLVDNIHEGKGETVCETIGINGLDCSGKTYLADKLSEYISEKNYKVNILHVDDFCDIKVIDEIYTRFQNGSFTAADVSNYYEECIDEKRLVEAINIATDESEILIIEGVFIFKSYLRGMIDLKIYLDVDEGQAFDRYIARKKTIGYENLFAEIWVASHKIYCNEVNPKKYADLIIENDFLQPKIEKYNQNIQWIAKTFGSLRNLQPLI